MADDSTLEELIRRIRGGDASAGEELVRSYGPAIIREAHLRLGPGVRPECDSMDICQSVFGSFFRGLAEGRYAPETPGRLLKLLSAMARNKIRESA